ncbi:dihydrodipicolinate synthase family protein [Rhizobium sp. RU36D]|uniref:dihydrodipicolinate synthase family protein n=1 Tax=Rhizobium sp. RU36D TaxID=1907415 RepID=UPI0009D8C7C7|nr:dihydrodipicolinate synthase family protein [Rhizobium sp. RU36D]SMC97786.1 4-hydroxy-tetrahydrodipicolinate synthase [Rhizobium sp. RU36D]
MGIQFRGSYTVTVTPFTADGAAIDYEALKRFLDWQIECGVPGVIILGTTGEFLTISDEERHAYVDATVKHVNGRMHVLVGAMNASTPKAAAYAKMAEDLGADGLMILPPYYYTPTEDEIYGYYKAICAATKLPIMLYNNPFTSNVDMSAKLVAKLTAAFEQVQYIKEASTDVGRVFDVIRESKGAMNVFAGERIVESFLLGAVGYVDPFGNYIPRATQKLWRLLEAGRIDDAKRIQAHITKIEHTIAEGHPTYGHQCYSKALASLAGYPVGDVRPPLTTFASLGDEGKQRLAVLSGVMQELDKLLAEIG